MFSFNIRSLPSCNTYEGAVRIWERAKRDARNKGNWPDGTRPLDDVRKTHYAVIKDGNNIVFRLHRTNCVEWYNPDHFYVDSSYDSRMTMDFIDRYVPEIRFERYKGQPCVRLGEQLFLTGRHTFRRFDGHNWQVASKTEKPTRQVLHPKKAAEVRAMTRDFSQWARAMWAVCGNDGNHPWVGQEDDIGAHTEKLLRALDSPDTYDVVAKLCLRTNVQWVAKKIKHAYAPTPVSKVISKLNTKLYELNDCYIRIDYDAPIPRD